MKKEEEMDEAGDAAAMKEALDNVRVKIRGYAIKKPVAQGEADGNVGEVMEREPQIEAMEEEVGQDLDNDQEDGEPVEHRTILESFTPRIVREQETLHVKRGPGRPRKNA